MSILDSLTALHVSLAKAEALEASGDRAAVVRVRSLRTQISALEAQQRERDKAAIIQTPKIEGSLKKILEGFAQVTVEGPRNSGASPATATNVPDPDNKKGKKGVGRPRLPKTETLSKKIPTNVTADEKYQFARAAEREGLTTSEWLRKLGQERCGKKSDDYEVRIPPEQMEVLRVVVDQIGAVNAELNAWGKNLNQQTKALNSFNLAAKELNAALFIVDACQQRVDAARAELGRMRRDLAKLGCGE
jgi:hypothetical protein